VPTAFNWGGAFDGATAGSTYGYANIIPNTAGPFYTGLQCGNNTWAGPFSLVRVDNSVVANYTADQFLEFSVNLSKLGLDPLVSVGDPCTMPFRRILVKSRSSASFSAELKDFVGPFDFFRAPMAAAAADIPVFCGMTGVSTLSVGNPLITSLYTWTTTDGNIVGSPIGPTITVDQPGSYIVAQELMDSCGTTYAKDTVVITLDAACSLLQQKDKKDRFVVNSAANKRAVLLLPNPVNSHLQLSIASPVKEAAAITIIDLSGRILQTTKRAVIRGTSILDIECPAHWRSGTYVIKVVLGNEIFTEKMILLR
jgi:hypothetical protein